MNLQGVVIPDVNEDFIETMSKPGAQRGPMARLVADGMLPEGVDEKDPRVQAIVKACGGDTSSREALHLFTDDDGNTYAARDLAHAKELWAADMGVPAEDSDVWTAIPDDRIIYVSEEDSVGAVVESAKTAAEWANEMSEPGVCFSTNY